MMNITTHTINNTSIAEIRAPEVIIASVGDGLDLLGNVYYQGFDKMVIYEENITPEFFDLSSGIAGEILQKFSNYRMRLAIVGDFSPYTGKSLQDFTLKVTKPAISTLYVHLPKHWRALQGAR